MIEAASPALPNLGGKWLFLARLNWVLVALVYISFFISGTIASYNQLRAPCSDIPVGEQAMCWPTEFALLRLGLTWDDLANFYTPIATVAALPLILIGCIIFWHKSEKTTGLLFSLVLVVGGCAIVNMGLIEGLINAFPDFIIPVAILRSLSRLTPIILCTLFPDGRFVARWTRWLFILWIGLLIYYFTVYYVFPSFDNSFWERYIDRPSNVLMTIAAAYALIFRYRYHAGPIQRQQIKWVMIGMSVVAICQILLDILGGFWRPGMVDLLFIFIFFPIYYLSFIFFAVCLGISISRYRLWDIDFIVNRTLVYSLLMALVVGIYVIVVGLLGTTIQGRSNLLVSILATGLVAVLVQPLRDLLQRGINRLMYGERDDPVTVLSRLGKRLETTFAPDAVLPALVETVAHTLKLPYVAVRWGEDRDREMAAAYGKTAGDLVHLPLFYQGETIGHLVVAPRASGEALTSADHYLLKSIAHQAGMALHAVSLTNDLQRSRQHLVSTREEERRRLRRDLHDGLGPALASQGLKLAAVRHLLDHDPDSALPLLDQVLEQNRSTVEEIRHLVYGLRPPALDELGLVAAIRDYVTGMEENPAVHIEVIEPPDGLPPLSAAVEVAAYRIVLEALTNVIRHAQAQHCRIQFSSEQMTTHHFLKIEIRDDGSGLSRNSRSGIGTRSMRERAEEVGGTYFLGSEAGQGTVVCVQVPFITGQRVLLKEELS
jgi:signal transduction histidine kinase